MKEMAGKTGQKYIIKKKQGPRKSSLMKVVFLKDIFCQEHISRLDGIVTK